MRSEEIENHIYKSICCGLAQILADQRSRYRTQSTITTPTISPSSANTAQNLQGILPRRTSMATTATTNHNSVRPIDPDTAPRARPRCPVSNEELIRSSREIRKQTKSAIPAVVTAFAAVVETII